MPSALRPRWHLASGRTFKVSDQLHPLAKTRWSTFLVYLLVRTPSFGFVVRSA